MLLGLAAIAAVMFVLQSLCLKRLPDPQNNRASFGLIAAYCSLIAAGLWVWSLFTAEMAVSTMTWLWGALYGVVFTSTMFCYTRAMNTGPLSYSSFYFSASLMVPVLASMTLWQEKAGIMRWIGLILFLLSFYFIQIYGRHRGKAGKIDKRWLAYCLLAFLFNGLIPVVAKTHQSLMGGREAAELTLVGFAVAALCSLLGWLVCGGYGEIRKSIKSSKTGPAHWHWPWGWRWRLGWPWRSMLLIIGVALSTGLGNALMNDLSGKLPGAYLYPLVNGSMIILLTFVSAVIFKERLTRGGAAGIVTGILAIIAVNL